MEWIIRQIIFNLKFKIYPWRCIVYGCFNNSTFKRRASILSVSTFKSIVVTSLPLWGRCVRPQHVRTVDRYTLKHNVDTEKTILRINEYHCFLNVVIPVTFKNIIHARQCYRRIFRRLRSVCWARIQFFSDSAACSSTPLSSQDVVPCSFLTLRADEIKILKISVFAMVFTLTHIGI